MVPRSRCSLYAAVASVLLLASSAAANVIGVDLGMDYMKVALVAPRRPLEIVTNTASKRKTEVAINFDRGERSFGGDALVMLSRKPEQTFTKMTSLLGRSLEHPDVQALESTGLPPLTWNATRGGLSLHLVDRGNEADYLPEELVAMVLSHAYDITEMFGYSVRDAVLAVPQFWTAHERRAMADAVELSGLSAISALDENTAAALQYGIDRAHDEPHNVLFYNIGAGATQATIVTYGPKLEKGKNVGEFTVRGKAWDTGLGGHWFDLVLTDLLAVEFNKQWKKGDVREYPKAMAKLRVHSSKVKQVLSANAEIPVTIQSLHDDVDFTTLVTRRQFETAAKSLLGRVTAPVTAALAAANLTVADLHGVEVIGGGVRIPKVQELLREHLQPLDLGVHLNGDEAVALGAAFSGANASRAFHVRQVGLTDITPFAVEVNLADLPSNSASDDESGGAFKHMFDKLKHSKDSKKQAKKAAAAKSDSPDATAGDSGTDSDSSSDGRSGEPFTKTIRLFNASATVTGSAGKKAFALTHARDITANVSYVQSAEANPFLPAGTQPMIATYSVTGIEKFAAETVKDGLGLPKVTLRFVMDAFGVPVLDTADATVVFDKEVTYEETVEVEDETAKNETASAETATAETTTTADTDAAAAATDSTSSSSSSADDEIATATADESTPAAAADSAAATDKDADAGTDKSDAPKGKKKGAKSPKGKKAEPKKAPKKKITVTKTKTVQQTKKRKLDVTVSYEHCVLRPMSAAEKAESKEKLGKLAAADAARHAKAAAKNDLEAYILMVRNAMGEDAKETLVAVTTDEQREELITLANNLEEWLYDDGWDEEAHVYRSKKHTLADPAESAFQRSLETIARPAEVARARQFLTKLRETVDKWKVSKPQITDQERDDLLEKVEKVEKWLDDKEQKQAAVPLHEAPVFYSTDVEPQLQVVRTLIGKLAKKPAPKPAEKPAKKGGKKKENSGGDGESTADGVEDEEVEDVDGDAPEGDDDVTDDVTDDVDSNTTESTDDADQQDGDANVNDGDVDGEADTADDSSRSDEL